MPAAPNLPDAPAASTPLQAKLFDILASPGDVFEEVVAAPPRIRNWLVPMLLAALTALILLSATGYDPHAPNAGSQMAEAGKLSAQSGEVAPFNSQKVSSLVNCLGVPAGTFWSAFLLWVMGFALLKTRFPYSKALEVVALTSVITTLGAILTALIDVNSGDSHARLALSLLARSLPADSRLYAALDSLSLFHIWATSVLSLGLARLSGVSFKAAAFWVFGYWVVARIVVLVLA